MISSPLLAITHGYIDGQWCEADSKQTMPVVNPATGKEMAIEPVMGQDETTRAVDAAANALATPASIEQRSVWLAQLADLITEHRPNLAGLSHTSTASHFRRLTGANH